MKVIICPGVHDPQLSDRFIHSVLTEASDRDHYFLFPTQIYPSYSPFHLYHWLKEMDLLTEDLLFISFSAGVVAAMGAAITLEMTGIKIRALIAIDGWGVPLWGNFPIYRLSHDYFTHWSSALLGTGKESFYSDPPREHLTMWQFPEICQGWIINQDFSPKKSSVKDYLQDIIQANTNDLRRVSYLENNSKT